MNSFPLAHEPAFRFVFGRPEGLPLLESLINAFFQAVGRRPIHCLRLNEQQGLGVLETTAREDSGRVLNLEVRFSPNPGWPPRSIVSLTFSEHDLWGGPQWLHDLRSTEGEDQGCLVVELRKLLQLLSTDPLATLWSGGERRDAVLWATFLNTVDAAWPDLAEGVFPALQATQDLLAEFRRRSREVPVRDALVPDPAPEDPSSRSRCG